MLWLLNYFWLSFDPVECAKWYCDQHCFKIGSEVIESVWDAVLELCPDLDRKADEKGFPKSNRKRRHSKPDSLWHPLSVWNAMCKANMARSLLNADAIFNEHFNRTGKSHQAWAECKFLTECISEIDFNSATWKKWYESQACIKKPSKTSEKDVPKRKEWFSIHSLTMKAKKSIISLNRNRCDMTEPPQCINESIPAFAGCKVDGDVITAYRKYYVAKAVTVSGGMRYFYTQPPSWLTTFISVKTERTTKKKKQTDKFSTESFSTESFSTESYLLDEEGYVVIKFSNE